MSSLEFTNVKVYYIYPFLFDLQLLNPPQIDKEKWEAIHSKEKVPINHITFWACKALAKEDTNLERLRKDFPLKGGLPEFGFLPLLPFNSLLYEVGHVKNDKDESFVKIITGKKGDEIPVYVRKTVIIRSAGIGTLTYEINLTGRNEFQFKDLAPLLRLVPRLWKWREKNDYFLFKNKLLHSEVYEYLATLESALLRCFGKKNKKQKDKDQDLWEDREVLNFESEEMPPHPYCYIVLAMKPNKYWELFEKVTQYPKSRNDKTDNNHLQELLSVIYRLWNLGEAESVHMDNLHEIKSLIVNQNIVTFLHHFSVVSILNAGDKNDFVKNFYVPTITNTVEHAVARYHFAVIIDALIDNITRGIGRVEYQELYESFLPKISRIKTQIGSFLENISMYVKSGHMGGDLVTMLEEVFEYNTIRNRILKKMELATDIFKEVASSKSPRFIAQKGKEIERKGKAFLEESKKR